ncbi:MAG: hypothetical protein NVS2B17_17800 [Candidatus Velthaea sp.]
MSFEHIWAYIFWIGIGIVGAETFVVQIPRSIREARRIVGRVKAYGDLPILRAADRGERDIARLSAAFEQLPALEARVVTALSAIRSVQLVPPVIRQAFGRVAGQILAFRRASRR